MKPTIYRYSEERFQGIIVVGEALSRKTDGNPSLAVTYEQIATAMGLTLAGYIRRVGRCNLIERYPGEDYPQQEAEENAAELIESGELDDTRVLLLGRRAMKAFRVELEYFRWYRYDDRFDVANLPHPSPRNRQWNDPLVRRKFHAFLGGLIS